MANPIALNSAPRPPRAGVIDYAPPPTSSPAKFKLGKYTVIAILCFMTFSWFWNLGHAVIRNRLTIFDGIQFVVSIYLMIYLWRGSPIARWVFFAIYALAGA